VPADAASDDPQDDARAASSGLQQAALAFSALPTQAAREISARLTLVERNRLREGLSRVRHVGEVERRDAVHALVRAVHAGVGFPAPAPHDEGKCPFRRVESTPAEQVATVLAACALTQPLLVATALCHLGAGYRAEVWSHLTLEQRGAVRVTLNQIPDLSATSTAMYALDLRDRIAHRR
jgi:hypothetical protein